MRREWNHCDRRRVAGGRHGFGDRVIVPAYTWDGTAAAVLFAGGVPVFADVDADTYCLDIEAARRAITPRTKATFLYISLF